MRKRVLSLAVFITLSILHSSAHAQAPQIPLGLSWLTSTQTATGNWPEVDTTEYYSTASALDAVYALEPSSPAYAPAFQWLSSQFVSPTDYLSRRIITLKRAGADVSSELEGLLLYRNPDGGWGGETSYLSNPLDTALALQALKAANYSDTTVIYNAINFLTTNQNSDGGWGYRPTTTAEAGDPSNAYVTAIVLRTLASYSSQFIVQSSLQKASAYLLTKQNTDGGFGSSPSTIYETALSVISLIESGQGSALPLQNAIAYLAASQSANGSWSDDPYSTALALQAPAKVRPNVALSSSSVALFKSIAAEDGTSLRTALSSGLAGAENPHKGTIGVARSGDGPLALYLIADAGCLIPEELSESNNSAP